MRRLPVVLSVSLAALGLSLGGTADAVGAPASLSISPVNAAAVAGTTASGAVLVLDDSGAPVEGAAIRVQEGTWMDAPTACLTDVAGRCAYVYPSPDFPGSDALLVFVDADLDGEMDIGEPRATGTRTWTLPAPSTSVRLAGGGTIEESGEHVANLSLRIRAEADGSVSGRCRVSITWIRPYVSESRCVELTRLTLGGSHATVFGVVDEEMNAGVHRRARIRIDLDDLSPEGVSDRVRIIVENGYLSEGPLMSGDVRIRS